MTCTGKKTIGYEITESNNKINIMKEIDIDITVPDDFKKITQMTSGLDLCCSS